MKSKSLIVKDNMTSKELTVKVDGLITFTNSLLKNQNTALTKAIHDAKLYLQIGHTDSINSMSITPDGKRIVSGSDDRTIKLWDIESGEELKTFYGHKDEVKSIAVTPDGKKIVSGSRDRTIKLWDIESGEELKTFYGHRDGVESIAITPDGKKIVSGSWDRTIKLWDIKSGEGIRIFYGHTGCVNHIAITPDGKKIISESNDKTIKLWDIESVEKLKICFYAGSIASMAITLDSKTIVLGTTYTDKIKITLLDIESGKELKKLQNHKGYIKDIVTMSNGKTVVFEQIDKTINLWDIKSKKDIKTYNRYIKGAIYSIAITPDCKKIVLGSWDGTIGIWNIQSEKEHIAHHNYRTYSRTIPIKSDYKIITYKDNIVTKKAQSKEELTILDSHTCGVTAIAITPDGKTIVSGNWDGTIKLWNIESGEQIKTLYGHKDSDNYNKYVDSIIISPDGKTIVSGGRDCTIKLWDIESGEEKRTYNIGMIFDKPMMGISPDGKLLVHTYDAQEIKILDMKNGKLVKSINTGTRGWSTLITNPDGKTIISCGGDTIKLWNIESGKKIKTLSQYNCGISLLAITPDGKAIVSSDLNGDIVLCDIESEKEIKTFQGHSNWGHSVAITPDSKYIASLGKYSDEIKIWDIKSGEELKTLYGHTGMIETIAITPDGKKIVSGSRDRTIKLWDIESGEELATFVSFGKDSWASITPDGYYNSSDSGLEYIKFVDKDGSFLPKEHEIYEQKKRKQLIKTKGL